MRYLEAVVSLCDKLGRPVHYTEVAENAGVSKWTAPEPLTFLSREGSLEQEYEIRREERSEGRSGLHPGEPG